ncbi:hypothetical protein H0H93_000002 [Arthromyces matolae]|nr:hypothetical protein H0H93_000002 [Arthromyces matolae]
MSTLLAQTHVMMLEELLTTPKIPFPTLSQLALSNKKPKPRARLFRSSPDLSMQRWHSSSSNAIETSDRTFAISSFGRNEQRIQKFQALTSVHRKDLNLEEAWNTYQDIRDLELPLSSLMAFVDHFCKAAEETYRKSTATDEELRLLGQRLDSMIDDLSTFIKYPGTKADLWRLAIRSRAFSMQGDYKTALENLHSATDIPLPEYNRTPIPYAYRSLMLALQRSKGKEEAMKFLGDEWSNVARYLDSTAPVKLEGPPLSAARQFRTLAERLAIELDDPFKIIEQEHWDKKRREGVGCFFILSYLHQHLPLESRELLFRLKTRNYDIPMRFQLLLIRYLSKSAGSRRAALDIYNSLKPTQHDLLEYKSTGIILYSRMGNVKYMEECFEEVKKLAAPSEETITSLIHGYGIAGLPERSTDIFEEYFPIDEMTGKRKMTPSTSAYAAIIDAHSRRHPIDHTAISKWLADLASQGHTPNQIIFTIVLNAFAAEGDLNSAMKVLEQMREANVQPNAVTYTIIITLLAHRKDPAGAESIFKLALKEGVKIDNRMIVAIMNAHVEGNSWRGVIRAYDYLAASQHIGLSLEVYNTLMKAYVLIGAPFNIVYRFFKRLEQTRTKPDAYTYALLVQSACDAGLMGIAADIYYDMEQAFRENPHRNLEANYYVLTILMAGFLRQGDKVKAKGVYDEMLDLGINPSPITYSTILSAYGNEKSEESMRIAEEFIKTLVAVPEKMRTWTKPKYDLVTPLHHLYGPVMTAWARMKSPDNVERVYQEMLEAGAPPSPGTLTALMDVYRRTFNVGAVMEIWPQIKELGLNLTSKDWMPEEDNPKDGRGLRGNILTVPLSIYIDALSSCGEHLEIASVWKDLRARGFSFDSHNWNHLTVALVRAGEVERAFEVLERVIIPYQELSITSENTRNRNPKSPLMTDAVNDEEGDASAVSKFRDRRIAAQLTAKHTRDIEGFRIGDETPTYDFAYHLHILHQISPAWASWKAHRATLSVLLLAFNRLHDGSLVHATQPNGSRDRHPIANEAQMARDILSRIYSNYPKTVQLVLEHNDKEKHYLTPEQYKEKYRWED